MSSSKETNVRKWDFENTKLFYEVLQGKFPENYPIHCDLKLTPEQAFDVIYILQEYFNAIPDVFEQCYRCKELYDSDCGGNHYDNVGINLCEWCEDHILYREGYGGDYETLDEYVEKWFKSTKSDSLRSTGQSGDGSGGGEEEADETCQVGKPLGSSPNIHGGMVEGLDPELRDILKHTNLIPCVQCRTEMDWVDGSHEFGELRLECPECHWTTCITDPKLMALYKHRKRST